MDTELVDLDLGDGLIVKVEAIDAGGAQLVDDDDQQPFNKLESLVDPVERIGKAMLHAAKAASPSKATIELEFGIAVESGHLFTVFGKGSGSAGLKVTLEWQGDGAE